MKVLCIIPARGGSQQVPGKNIRLLAGKPLIAYAIRAALDSQSLDRIIVSTDDEKIAQIAKEYGAEVPFLRPKELAKDDTPDLPVFQHAISYLEKKENYFSDVIVHLRVTTPFRTGQDIDAAVEKLIAKNADGVRTVNLVRETPYWMDVVVDGDILKPFISDGRKYQRRQDLPKVYATNGLVDVVRRDIIMKKNSMYAQDNQRAIIIERLRGLQIDDELDFFILEQIIKKGLLKKWPIL